MGLHLRVKLGNSFEVIFGVHFGDHLAMYFAVVLGFLGGGLGGHLARCRGGGLAAILRDAKVVGARGEFSKIIEVQIVLYGFRTSAGTKVEQIAERCPFFWLGLCTESVQSKLEQRGL